MSKLQPEAIIFWSFFYLPGNVKLSFLTNDHCKVILLWYHSTCPWCLGPADQNNTENKLIERRGQHLDWQQESFAITKE